MPRLLATYLIAFMVLTGTMAPTSIGVASAAPEVNGAVDTMAAAVADMAAAKLIGSSGATYAALSAGGGCTQSSVAPNCAFVALTPQYHSIPSDIRGGAMLAMAEETRLASKVRLLKSKPYSLVRDTPIHFQETHLA